MASELCAEEWQLVRELLPADLEARARQCGALRRARGVQDAETLLRVLLLHTCGGLSLQQTSLRAAELGLAELSAVALFKRLRASGAWLEDLCKALLEKRTDDYPFQWPLKGRTFRAFDASDIREPGATGSSWKLHYSITLPGLRCDQAAFTDRHHGERLQNFTLHPGDVILADRAYGKRAQIAWLMDAGADAVIRLHPPALPACEQEPEDQTDLPVKWLEKLQTLPPTGAGEWTVRFRHQRKHYPVRVCAIRKSLTAAADARRKVKLEARKKRRTLRPETLSMADFVVVLTTLQATEINAEGVLELYRQRWQIELAFKRLKSLLGMSAVPKSDPQSARSWMQSKLLEALLIERLLEQSRALSPWGYRL